MNRIQSRGPSLAGALIALAVLGAAAGFLAAGTAQNRLLFREPLISELPSYFQARSLDRARPDEPAGAGSAPLYSVALHSLKLVASSPAPVRRFQLVFLGALIPLLAGWASARAFGRRTALPAGLLALLTGPLWLHLVAISPAGWQAALALAALAIGAPFTGAGVGRCLVVGLLLGVARLFGAAWAPVLALLWAAAGIWKNRPAAVAVLLGAAILFTAPLMNRPGKTALALPPLMNGGMESAYGFHDGASGIEPRRADTGAWRWYTPRDLAIGVERETHKTTSPADLPRIGSRVARAWVIGHPLAAAGLFVKKALLAVSTYDPPSPVSLAFYAGQVLPAARPLLFSGILILGLGLAGIVFGRSAGRPATARSPGYSIDTMPVLLMALATLLTGAFFYVRSPDRLAFLLAMTGPAAWAVMALLFPRAEAGDRGPAAAHPPVGRGPLLGVAVAGAVVLSWPWLLMARAAEAPADDHFALGSVYDRLKRPSESAAEWDKALRLDPGHVVARVATASSLMRDGLYDQAIPEAERTTRDAPFFIPGWRILATANQQAQHFDASAQAWKRLTELDPMNPEVWNNLGTIYATLNRYDDAVGALRQALVVDPNYRNARINLAALEKRGPQGLQGAMPSTTGGASMTALQQGLAQVQASMQNGDVPGAEKLLNELKATYGGTPDLDLAGGTIALQKGDWKQAVELLERCRKALSGNVSVLINLATAYAQLGRLGDAIPIYEEALKIDPTNAIARQNLERARTQQQQKSN